MRSTIKWFLNPQEKRKFVSKFNILLDLPDLDQLIHLIIRPPCGKIVKRTEWERSRQNLNNSAVHNFKNAPEWAKRIGNALYKDIYKAFPLRIN